MLECKKHRKEIKMSSRIREMREGDKDAVLQMMRVFYASPAVLTSGSEEIFLCDIDACLSDSPYLEGYILENGDEIQGYAMVAKSFSTEFGKPCIWIEDLYIKAEYRGLGLGGAFLESIGKKYAGCVFRLEAEEENEGAVRLYERKGFQVLPYLEMIKGLESK